MAGNVFSTKRNGDVALCYFRVLIVENRFGINLQRIFSFDLDVSQKGNNAVLRIINSAVGEYLIGLLGGSSRVDCEIDVFQFVMAVSKSYFARGPQPKVQPISFSNALLVPLHPADPFL